MKPTAIKISDLSFAYNELLPTLVNLNLTVEVGEFLAVIGPNGGGKTTLLKLIMGLLKPTTGKVLVFDQSPNQVSKTFGYVPQFSNFSKDFPITVEKVVIMGRLGKKRGFSYYSSEDYALVQTILQQMGIEHLKESTLNELSGGQLQRVLIARALACQPQLLLLDEPTANIDIHGEENLFESLKKINQSGITILLVSHDIGFVSKYITRVACVNHRLVCHHPSNLTSKIIQQLYDMPINIIEH